MTLIQALILSVLQGASELFPVSSLGHAVIVPALLHWRNAPEILNPEGPFLPFLVTLHLGTALALLIYYWSDWRRIITAFFEQFTKRGGITRDAQLANLVIAGTIPTALIAFVLEKKLRLLFASPKFAAIFLIVNGALMLGGELLRRRSSAGTKAFDTRHAESAATHTTIARLDLKQAVGIGLAQSLALIPGISRSGATITAGLSLGLSHEDALRFSFLLATPIILLAGLHEVPKLRHLHQAAGGHMGLYSVIGFFVSGVTAWLSVKFLERYFKTNRLDPFAYYCIALGLVTLGVIAAGR